MKDWALAIGLLVVLPFLGAYCNPAWSGPARAHKAQP